MHTYIHTPLYNLKTLEEQSATFLASHTGFMGDIFPHTG